MAGQDAGEDRDDSLERLPPDLRLNAQVHALELLVSAILLNDLARLDDAARADRANRLMIQVDHAIGRAQLHGGTEDEIRSYRAFIRAFVLTLLRQSLSPEFAEMPERTN